MSISRAEKRISDCLAQGSTRLDLSHLELIEVPSSVAQLTHLTTLYLSENQLETIPEFVSQLPKLKTLAIDNNRLRTLPESFGRLSDLTYLYLHYNELNTLPYSLGRLGKLTTLDLSENQLHRLPVSFTYLDNLTHLHLDNNPLEEPPLEVALRGMDAIRIYFAERAQGDVGLFESKLLLVGEPRVGKTALSKALRTPNYQLKDEASTEGIDIQSWIIPAAETGMEQDIRLNVWDFGGQEIYHATHQFFLTKRSLYLLVTESRKEDRHEDFYYWFNIIRLLSDNAPVIVVLNKCDQPTKELPITEYRNTFQNIVDYVKVSCADSHRETIENLRATIRHVLTNKTLMPHVEDRLPQIWMYIRQELADLRERGVDYIAYSDFCRICARYGMVEAERIKVLSEYFHDLGIFLHFSDDLALSETVFLNHDWVTDGVYKVLDNPTVIERKGHFSNATLVMIWSAEKYQAKRRELLALMKNSKFELCYELPAVRGHRQEYLVPQLLPPDEVPFPWRTPLGNRRFEYHYTFMPKGIVARLIVKLHNDIVQGADGPIHWRYGVLLEMEGTRAIVRERYFERKLTIQLEGKDCSEYLAIIRRSINEIHNDFNDPAVALMVPCNCKECADAENPHFFDFALLRRYEAKSLPYIRCDKSLEDVNVQNLLRETNPYASTQGYDNHESDLHDAIQDAFSLATLKQAVHYRLGQNLETIAGGGNLSEIAYNLIQWAARTGRFRQLAHSLLEENPGNEKFREVVERL